MAFENNKPVELKGRFTRILKGGESSNWTYTLALFLTKDKVSIPVFMTNKKIDLDVIYNASFKENSNKKYKESLVLESFSLSKPETEKEVEHLLLSQVEGLGKKTLEKIKENFGKNYFQQFLSNLDSFKNFLSEKVFDSLKKFMSIYNNKSFSFFIENGLSLFYSKLVEKFGSIDFLAKFKEENPYILYVDYGFSFSDVDLFANKVKNLSIFEKVYGYTHYYLNIEIVNNNTLISTSTILEKVTSKLKISIDQFLINLQKMIQNNDIYFDKESNSICLQRLRDKEKDIVKTLLGINNLPKSKHVIKTSSIHWSELQSEALRNAINEPLSIISGFPGTGKSFIIKYIYNYFIDNSIYKANEIEILTPTGKAATNIQQKFLVPAKTIHSFLKLERDESLDKNYYIEPSEKTKVLIVDEFSMVNINIFYLLLENVPKLEKLIIVGDANQLPCIGPGNMMAEIIQSKIFPTTILQDIFRTDKIDICEHFLSIKKHEIPQVNTEWVHFVNLSEEKFLKNIESYFKDLVLKYGIENVAVLIPVYKSLVGIKNVNNILQKWNILEKNNNTFPKLKISFDFKNGETLNYYVGDKVVQLENDYDKKVFNGEIGFITKIDEKGCQIDFDGKLITYTLSELRENISLAYAITVHKFQGSESKAIIFPIFNEYAWMLKTKLLYTAISRAQKEILLLGDYELYTRQITNKFNNLKIKTSMKQFLLEAREKDL